MKSDIRTDNQAQVSCNHNRGDVNSLSDTVERANLLASGAGIKSNSNYIKHSSYGGRTVQDWGCYHYIQYDERLRSLHTKETAHKPMTYTSI